MAGDDLRCPDCRCCGPACPQVGCVTDCPCADDGVWDDDNASHYREWDLDGVRAW